MSASHVNPISTEMGAEWRTRCAAALSAVCLKGSSRFPPLKPGILKRARQHGTCGALVAGIRSGSCHLRDSAVLILARGGGLPFGVTRCEFRLLRLAVRPRYVPRETTSSLNPFQAQAIQVWSTRPISLFEATLDFFDCL